MEGAFPDRASEREASLEVSNSLLTEQEASLEATNDLSTDELLLLLKARQDEAWKYLYARYMSGLVYQGIKKGLLYEDAEEVAHDTLFQVARCIDSYNETLQTGNQWICTIHRNKIIDRLRQKRDTASLEDRRVQLLATSEASPEEHVMNGDRRIAITQAWDRLPEWARIELQGNHGPGRKKKVWHEAVKLFRALLGQEERS